MTERCYAYQDDEDDATRCIRERGHASSHLTSRGACWPNPAAKLGKGYVGPRHTQRSIVKPWRVHELQGEDRWPE